jgi:hypothetical protein
VKKKREVILPPAMSVPDGTEITVTNDGEDETVIVRSGSETVTVNGSETGDPIE